MSVTLADVDAITERAIEKLKAALPARPSNHPSVRAPPSPTRAPPSLPHTLLPVRAGFISRPSLVAPAHTGGVPRQSLGAEEWRDGDYAGAVQGYTAEPKVGWCAPPPPPSAPSLR